MTLSKRDPSNPYARIADLEAALAHQRALTAIERRRADALDQQVRVA